MVACGRAGLLVALVRGANAAKLVFASRLAQGGGDKWVWSGSYTLTEGERLNSNLAVAGGTAGLGDEGIDDAAIGDADGPAGVAADGGGL